MKTRRQERMEALIQKEISALIEQEIDCFAEFFVTITEVSVSPDFRNVKIYYSILGDDAAKKKFRRKLEKSKSYIRFCLGNKIDFRTVPFFSFEYDENVEKASRIENILYEIKHKEKIKSEEK